MVTTNLHKYAQRFGNHKGKILEAAKGNKMKAADLMRRLDLSLTDINYRKYFFDSILEEDLSMLIGSAPPSNIIFEKMHKSYLLPTHEMLKCFLDGNFNSIENRNTAIREGFFDRENKLDMEIEYSRFRRLHDKDIINLEKFMNLPFRKDDSVVLLSSYEKEKAIDSSLEAINVYNFIKSIKSKRPKLVIGNIRYGSLFVVEPIEEYLTIDGIKVAYERASSEYFEWHQNDQLDLSQNTSDFIHQNNPQIFVVDGTQNIKKNDLTRFPFGLIGYINYFKDYSIDFWASDLTEDVYVGNIKFRNHINKDRNKKLTLITSTSGNYTSSNFDNPETYAENKTLCFTPYGFSYQPTAKSTDLYVKEVQRLMAEEIRRQLK